MLAIGGHYILSKEVVHYGDWQPPKELLEEYKEEIEAFHKWAESSRQYRDKNGKK